MFRYTDNQRNHSANFDLLPSDLLRPTLPLGMTEEAILAELRIANVKDVTGVGC